MSINEIAFRVTRSQHEPFWQKVSAGQWEPETFRIFDRLLDSRMTYLDVGTWIGPTLLYASQRAGRSYGFEPDPLAFQELTKNISLNPNLANLSIHNVFVGTTAGPVVVGSQTGGNDSSTSVLFADSPTRFEVDSIRLQDFVAAHGVQAPLFIKIDIEGAEYSLVPSIMDLIDQHRPVVFLSVHPWFLSMSLSSGRGLLSRLVTRARLVSRHYRLLSSLRTLKYAYDVDGNRMNRWVGLVRVALRGRLNAANAIVLMPHPWRT